MANQLVKNFRGLTVNFETAVNGLQTALNSLGAIQEDHAGSSWWPGGPLHPSQQVMDPQLVAAQLANYGLTQFRVFIFRLTCL